MDDVTRRLLVEILKTEMGIIPDYVAQEGGTEEGYRSFLDVPRLNTADGMRVYKFVAWNEEQLEVIKNHENLFQEWFSMGEE